MQTSLLLLSLLHRLALLSLNRIIAVRNQTFKQYEENIIDISNNIKRYDNKCSEQSDVAHAE